MERKIIIGLITSTNYLKEIHSIWNPQLIESSTAKQIAGWCWEYYDKYRKAPGKDIEDIFYKKLKTLPKDVGEDIESNILPNLSEEYTRKKFDLKYLVDETKKYFSERNLLLYTETIQSLINSDQLTEAQKAVNEFKPLDLISDKLDRHVLSVHQIKRLNKPQPTILMSPWLREGQISIIYGSYGVGKSLLVLSIAYVLGVENYYSKECEIGKWQVKNPTGTLYIDGELGALEMEERVGQFEWLGEQPPKHRLRILSIPEYQLETEDVFYLSDRDNQFKIIKWLKDHPTYRLVILDSASTLFGLQEENSNSEWNNKVNPLLRDLRALGVSCILLHHAGKDNKKGLRGASSMGAMAQNVFRIINHPSKDIDEGQAWFTLLKDKQRSAGFSFNPFSLKYIQGDDQKTTTWEVTENYET